ncbi:hypothetical protein XFF6166_970021 [Xanthomonas citri pv. fuscans]|nr:hypothetical protein XFF6166_970021 [Xanthomonas citri pv. fuscans]SOO00689.1 hypothetical protein XFF6960_360013 [Xanthomonas citri pv. fuscans]SOO13152.1 hypothetical protein XFF7766_1210013 [Xanthomonas citri pv. fuscans]
MGLRWSGGVSLAAGQSEFRLLGVVHRLAGSAFQCRWRAGVQAVAARLGRPALPAQRCVLHLRQRRCRARSFGHQEHQCQRRSALAVLSAADAAVLQVTQVTQVTQVMMSRTRLGDR